jgi:hypothetical protein
MNDPGSDKFKGYFCIWLRVLPRSRPHRASPGRKPIHRDP